jgi:hypothetical protein
LALPGVDELLSNGSGGNSLQVRTREQHYVDQERSLRGYSASFEDGRRLHVKDGEQYYSAEGKLRGPLAASDEEDEFEAASGMGKMTLRVERGNGGRIQGLAVKRAGSDEWKRFERVPVL